MLAEISQFDWGLMRSSQHCWWWGTGSKKKIEESGFYSWTTLYHFDSRWSLVIVPRHLHLTSLTIKLKIFPQSQMNESRFFSCSSSPNWWWQFYVQFLRVGCDSWKECEAVSHLLFSSRQIDCFFYDSPEYDPRLTPCRTAAPAKARINTIHRSILYHTSLVISNETFTILQTRKDWENITTTSILFSQVISLACCHFVWIYDSSSTAKWSSRMTCIRRLHCRCTTVACCMLSRDSEY